MGSSTAYRHSTKMNLFHRKYPTRDIRDICMHVVTLHTNVSIHSQSPLLYAIDLTFLI